MEVTMREMEKVLAEQVHQFVSTDSNFWGIANLQKKN
jgi:hypothetical protein